MENVSNNTNSSTDIHLQKKSKTEDKTRSVIIDFTVLECPFCFELLSTPVFQCENGHLTCSVCCPKLNKKCPSCKSSIGHIRCRAIESVVESILVSCPNEDFGCSKKLTFGDLSTHEKQCVFSPLSCPIQDCNYTDSYHGLYDHFKVSHFDNWWYSLRVACTFRCGISFSVPMKLDQNIKIIMEDKKRLLFAVQGFKEPYGMYVTVSIIAPSSLDIPQFSYHISYTVDGHTLTYESPEMRRIQEVCLETPRNNFMLIPSSLSCGGLLKFMIRDLNQKTVLNRMSF